MPAFIVLLAEVQQEANTEVGQPQVSRHLAMMNRNQPFRGLTSTMTLFYDEVGIGGTRNLQVFVDERNGT